MLLHTQTIPVDRAMIPCGCRKGRQQNDFGNDRTAGTAQRQRQQADTVGQRIAGFRYRRQHRQRTGRAVTLTDQRVRRIEPVVGGAPVAHHRRHRRRIARQRKQRGCVGIRNRHRHSGSGRIDEDQIGHVQQAVLVIDETLLPFIPDQPPRSEGFGVKRRGRGARSAVENKEYRPRRVGIAPAGDIGIGDDHRRSFPGLVCHRRFGNDGVVGDGPAVHPRLVPRNDYPIGRLRAFHHGFHRRQEGRRHRQAGILGGSRPGHAGEHHAPKGDATAADQGQSGHTAHLFGSDIGQRIDQRFDIVGCVEE